MKLSENENVKLIEFGLGGSIMHIDRNHTVHGYADAENLFTPYHWWADPPEKMTYHVEPEKAEGALVIDKRPAIETEAGYRAVFRFPLVDPDLEEGKIDRLPDLKDSIVAMALRSQRDNRFGTMLRDHEAARKQQGEAPGPLDHVDPVTYARLWKSVGARVGRVKSGKIEWET